MLNKSFVVRDSDYLFVGGSKHITIGLYGGGLAAFLDGFHIEFCNDVRRVVWQNSIGVKGFTWKGGEAVNYEQLADPNNWRPKTNNKDYRAGFIIETSAVTKLSSPLVLDSESIVSPTHPCGGNGSFPGEMVLLLRIFLSTPLILSLPPPPFTRSLLFKRIASACVR